MEDRRIAEPPENKTKFLEFFAVQHYRSGAAEAWLLALTSLVFQ
jgi:hypothetical protein